VPFEIELTSRAERDLRKLSRDLQPVAKHILLRLASGDPALRIKPLVGRPGYRARSGDVRVLFSQAGGTRQVTRILPRRDAYR
jgi:mRNA-degrading endonuclease RelE of RelBE toxin-antitoxin system